MSRAPYRHNHPVDFIVVGSGAAGGAVAKELAVAGFEVVVLEQGPYLRPKDFKHDEVLVRNLHQLTNDPKRPAADVPEDRKRNRRSSILCRIWPRSRRRYRALHHQLVAFA